MRNRRFRGFRDGGPRFEHRHRLSADDVSAFADARIAALKAGLELTPDQTKNWPAFETALRNMVQLRIDRIKARQAASAGRRRRRPRRRRSTGCKRADAMSKRSVALKQIADAGAPLYQSLNDAQKARFTMLARMLRPHPRFTASTTRRPQLRSRRPRPGRTWLGGACCFGENGYSGSGQGQRQDGQDGRGWRHGHMHNLMNNDGDQDLQL